MLNVNVKVADPVNRVSDLNAEIVPGTSIRIYGDSGRGAEGAASRFDLVFSVGDRAVLGQYNMIYVGTITAIGAKTVTIKQHDETKRLDLFNFVHHNWDFDAVAIARHNDAEMMCI